MLRIAICDDNLDDLANMVSIVNDYIALQRDKHSIKYTAFLSAVELIAAMESGNQYDLVLLDVLMPFMTGIEAAKEIRLFNQDVKIIFLTSSTEFALESYTVGAYYYALKPIWKEKLSILLDKVLSEMQIRTGISVLVKSKDGLARIYINRLEFAEVIGRTVHYHITDGSVIEATGSMTELEKVLLSNACFIKTHRSYICNIEHIAVFTQRELKMQSRALVPMAKANYGNVKSAYIAFSFTEP